MKKDLALGTGVLPALSIGIGGTGTEDRAKPNDKFDYKGGTKVKFRVVMSVIALISLLALVGAGVGCARGGAAEHMMKKIPQDATMFAWIDMRALRGDDDLKDMYADMEDSLEYLPDMAGIELEDVNRVGTTNIGFDGVVLLDGRFNLNEVRNKLEDLNYDQGDYKDVEVWETQSYYDTIWLALMGNLIIMGTSEAVSDCITLIREGGKSFVDNRDVKDLIDRLPGGIVMALGIGDAFADLIDEDYEGLEAGAMSYGKKDEDTLKMTAVLKFEDADAANAAIDEIKDDLEDEGYKQVDVDQDGEFMTVTAEIDIDDFLAL